MVVLNLEWAPHSGFDAFTRTPEARIPASELRAMFQRYRLGPASRLFPSYPLGSLPEMTCFTPTKCDCVHYETGDIKRSPKVGYCDGHYCYRQHGKGKNGQIVRMRIHSPKGVNTFLSLKHVENSTCLVTTYQYDILVCKKTDSNKVKPTHEWLHAMDPDTYSHPHASHFLPLCKDKACINYYRRPKKSGECSGIGD